MTIKEALEPQSREGIPVQSEPPAQHPEANQTLATSIPPSLPDTDPTLGVQRTHTTPVLQPAKLTTQTKVAIPRQRSGIAPRYNRRVPRACESCRQRKTKCSGDTPVCRQCRELRATCNYPQGWRERTKK
jgi:hypothetical protein